MLMGYGGACEVLQLRLYRGDLRQWIAATTVFALAVHLVLSAVVVGHFAASKAAAASAPFVICHGTGQDSPADPDGSQDLPGDQSHCVLCSLTSDACGIIAPIIAIEIFASSALLQRAILRDSQVVHFDSLASEYPRGPPTHAHVVG
jgi:hypothetical protein